MRGNTVIDDLSIAIQKRECNKIIKKVRSGNLKLAKFPSYTSCMRIFTKDIKPLAKQAKRGGDLKGSVSRDANAEHTLINRIKNFNMLRTQLSQLKEEECLEKKTFADGASGYTIRNIINLEKRMGSKSRNSSVYLTTISGVPKTNPIVAKVMLYNTNNILEVDLMTMITNSIILKGISRHFLMTFGDCVCAKRIAKKLRYMSINELADGDLKMLIEIKDVVEDTELMFNMLIQIYISIATYHNLVGFVHRDTHFGNFLYQTNSEKGYYHYTFQGKDYYLKSCKYNMMIYDYGFSKKIDSPDDAEGTIKKKEAIFNDYQKIIHAFIMRKSKGWISLTNIPSYKETNYKMIWIANMLDVYIQKELTYHAAQSSSSFAALIFSNLLQDVFLKYAPNSMFISQRPPNVINQIPFRID
jgi:ribosomal protein L19E